MRWVPTCTKIVVVETIFISFISTPKLRFPSDRVYITARCRGIELGGTPE